MTKAKLDLRRAPKDERVAELRRWLDPDEIARLIGPNTGADAALALPPWRVRLDAARG